MGAEARRFTIIRKADESGVSGPGRVLDGVEFHTGQVVVCWRTEQVHGHSSLGVYDSFDAFRFIHIDSHPTNETEIVWLDGDGIPVRYLKALGAMVDRSAVIREPSPARPATTPEEDHDEHPNR